MLDLARAGYRQYWSIRNTMKRLLGVVALAAIAIAGSPAFANTVTLGSAGQILCNGASDAIVGCAGMTGGSLVVTNPGNQTTGGTAGVLDLTAPYSAVVYNPGNDSEANEIAALNILAGTSFSTTDATRTSTGGVSSLSFSTLAEWVIIKLGAGTLFIKNMTGGAMALNIDFSQIGPAGGISHYTEVGEIPLPAALWLMGAGLAGLGFAGRRKKA